MFEKFSEDARRAVLFAQKEAERFGSSRAGPEHLLLGLLQEFDAETAAPSGARILLEQSGVSVPALRAETTASCVRGGRRAGQKLTLTQAAQETLVLASEEAARLGSSRVGTEHLLLGLLRRADSIEAAVLNQFGVSLASAHHALRFLTVYWPEGQAPPPQELMTPDEAAAYLGVGLPLLYRLLGRKKLLALRLDGQWRFVQSWVLRCGEDDIVPLRLGAERVSVLLEDAETAWAFFDPAQAFPSRPAGAPAPEQLSAPALLLGALLAGVSELSLEPSGDTLWVRSRRSGALQEKALPRRRLAPWAAEWSAMAEGIAQKKIVKKIVVMDRRYGKEYLVRVSPLPAADPEAVMLHLWERSGPPPPVT